EIFLLRYDFFKDEIKIILMRTKHNSPIHTWCPIQVACMAYNIFYIYSIEIL
ncbi:hypothetical protein ACJX0J_019952, partial [Zea mays]